ncbi:MAG: glycosyltransferase family 39 protein [Gaiellaceae bacterium]
MQDRSVCNLFLGNRQAIRRTYTLDIAVVAVLALAARLPWALIVHAGPSSDSLFYYLGAKSIAAGHGYEIFHHPTAFFPVGWPVFLAGLFLITGPSFIAVKVAALLLWMLTTALVYLLGRRLGGRSVGLVAGVLVAVAPTMTIYAMRAASEHLFIPLLLAVCLLVVTADGRTPSMRRAALAGVFLGLAILVRSTAILLPLVVPLWLLLRRPAHESWRAAVTMAVVSVLVLTPWMARNAAVMHTFGLSTNGGYTIWIGAHPGASGGFDVGDEGWAIRSVASETHQNSALLRESIHYVVHHPLDWLGLIPAKFEHLMIWQPGPLQDALKGQRGIDPRYGGYQRQIHGAEATLLNGSLHHLWLFKLWHYPYWVFGGLALVLATRRRLPGASLAALLVGFWIVFHVTLVHGEPRYMLSVTPLVAPALAWLLVAAARRIKTFAKQVRAGQSQ